MVYIHNYSAISLTYATYLPTPVPKDMSCSYYVVTVLLKILMVSYRGRDWHFQHYPSSLAKNPHSVSGYGRRPETLSKRSNWSGYPSSFHPKTETDPFSETLRGLMRVVNFKVWPLYFQEKRTVPKVYRWVCCARNWSALSGLTDVFRANITICFTRQNTLLQ